MENTETNDTSKDEKIQESQENSAVEAAYTTSVIDTEKTEIEPIEITEERNIEPEVSEVIKQPEKINEFETIFTAIEDALPKQDANKRYAFPHPRYWVGPRFMAIWALPFVGIKKATNSVGSLNPIRPYKEVNYKVKNSETIYTAAKSAFGPNDSMKFMGARFITIWVLPLAITGTVMEFLFVSPLMGVRPFG